MTRQNMSPSCRRGGMKSARVQWWVEVQTFATYGHVGESHTAVVPTLLDSLGSDKQPSNLIPGNVGGHSDDECSSARSESCWGEMEDIRNDEVVDWGVTHSMSFVHVVPSLHALNCDRVAVRAEPKGGRSEVKRSHPIRHSQRETVAASSPPSSRNRFRCFGRWS